MIKERLTGRMKEAMKGGDARLLEAIRFLLAEVQRKEKDKQAQGKDPALTDEETIAVLQKEAKKRREAIVMYQKGGRAELAAKEEYELKLIEEYLPKAMTRAEVEKIVDAVLKDGAKDFTVAMRESMKRAQGKADGKTVSEIIKEKLQ